MRRLLASAAITLAAASPLGASADDPTPEQRTQIENCRIMSGAVFEFAEARDKKQSKMAAFKNVTHGQTYVAGSLLDETLQWAYAHPEEQPDTASAHFYGRCVLDAYEARNPDSEGELDIAAAACQQGHPGAPADVRDCIDDQTHDIIARVQTAVAAAASSSPAPAAATLTAAPSTSIAAAVVATAPGAATKPAVPAAMPATVVAAATPATPSSQAPALLPVPAVANPPAASPIPVAPVQAVASAPVRPVAAPLASTPSMTPNAPALPAAQPMAASAQTLPSPPPTVTPIAPPPVETPAPATLVAQAQVAPAPATEQAQPQAPATPSATSLPPLPAASAVPANLPPDLTGYGKLTLGMSMDDAYKALGSRGDTEWDEQGEVHSYFIGGGHGFMELRPSSAGTLYSIRVVGGADAHLAPILNVVLGDGAFVLINNVGLPSSRTSLPGDKELWNYRGRNYAFEISPGGDVIGLRITDLSRVQDSGAAP